MNGKQDNSMRSDDPTSSISEKCTVSSGSKPLHNLHFSDSETQCEQLSGDSSSEESDGGGSSDASSSLNSSTKIELDLADVIDSCSLLDGEIINVWEDQSDEDNEIDDVIMQKRFHSESDFFSDSEGDEGFPLTTTFCRILSPKDALDHIGGGFRMAPPFQPRDVPGDSQRSEIASSRRGSLAEDEALVELYHRICESNKFEAINGNSSESSKQRNLPDVIEDNVTKRKQERNLPQTIEEQDNFVSGEKVDDNTVKQTMQVSEERGVSSKTTTERSFTEEIDESNHGNRSSLVRYFNRSKKGFKKRFSFRKSPQQTTLGNSPPGNQTQSSAHKNLSSIPSNQRVSKLNKNCNSQSHHLQQPATSSSLCQRSRYDTSVAPPSGSIQSSSSNEVDSSSESYSDDSSYQQTSQKFPIFLLDGKTPLQQDSLQSRNTSSTYLEPNTLCQDFISKQDTRSSLSSPDDKQSLASDPASDGLNEEIEMNGDELPTFSPQVTSIVDSLPEERDEKKDNARDTGFESGSSSCVEKSDITKPNKDAGLTPKLIEPPLPLQTPLSPDGSNKAKSNSESQFENKLKPENSIKKQESKGTCSETSSKGTSQIDEHDNELLRKLLTSPIKPLNHRRNASTLQRKKTNRKEEVVKLDRSLSPQSSGSNPNTSNLKEKKPVSDNRLERKGRPSFRRRRNSGPTTDDPAVPESLYHSSKIGPSDLKRGEPLENSLNSSLGPPMFRPMMHERIRPIPPTNVRQNHFSPFPRPNLLPNQLPNRIIPLFPPNQPRPHPDSQYRPNFFLRPHLNPRSSENNFLPSYPRFAPRHERPILRPPFHPMHQENNIRLRNRFNTNRFLTFTNSNEEDSMSEWMEEADDERMWPGYDDIDDWGSRDNLHDFEHYNLPGNSQRRETHRRLREEDFVDQDNFEDPPHFHRGPPDVDPPYHSSHFRLPREDAPQLPSAEDRMYAEFMENFSHELSDPNLCFREQNFRCQVMSEMQRLKQIIQWPDLIRFYDVTMDHYYRISRLPVTGEEKDYEMKKLISEMVADVLDFHDYDTEQAPQMRCQPQLAKEVYDGEIPCDVLRSRTMLCRLWNEHGVCPLRRECPYFHRCINCATSSGMNCDHPMIECPN